MKILPVSFDIRTVYLMVYLMIVHLDMEEISIQIAWNISDPRVPVAFLPNDRVSHGNVRLTFNWFFFGESID